MNRSESKAAGLKRYTSSKICPRNHNSERMVSNGRCVKCIQEDKFSRRRKIPDEHKNYMREWHRKNSDHEKKYRIKNKKTISYRSMVWRIKNKDRHAENSRLWRIKNKDRADDNRRKWRSRNRERDGYLAKRWRTNNPEKQKIIMFNRNCASRGVKAFLNSESFSKMMKSQNYKCVYCDKYVDKEFHIDHKTPVSRGGDSSTENLQILCPKCNLKKSSKTHEEFLSSIGASHAA